MFSRQDPLSVARARVSAAVVSFTEAATALEEVAADLQAISDEENDFAEAALERASIADAEADRALDTARNIRTMIGE